MVTIKVMFTVGLLLDLSMIPESVPAGFDGFGRGL